MEQFATEFMKSLGPHVSSQLAGTLGIKNQTANPMIPNVVPLILGGLGGLLGRLTGSGR